MHSHDAREDVKHKSSGNNQHHSSHRHRHTHDKSSDLERRKINSEYKQLKNKRIIQAIKRTAFIVFVFVFFFMAIYYANNPKQTVGIRRFFNNKNINSNEVNDFEKRILDIEEHIKELEERLSEYEKIIATDELEW